ncbi:IclR family transcriptional regulator [Micromonospora inyonensis]|uniref:DNA-binding transcriptional regulator, IclR family n=1 Tax=Micromonospora inyonensis TaxID=47866 RepID=A0A1C6SHN5_9ACTN|nr:IclR family transcriptional regulator [Micromonospora inyonensis]SCL29006.1 DNA-binding transcriptional regulator, IclR family [Micromonospora inyonensis]
MTSIKVLDKAVAVLDHLAETGQATPAEISAAIDEPRGTVYRLIRNLAQYGYLEPTADGSSFHLGGRLFELGTIVAARFADLQSTAGPAMERLNRETGQTVFLTVRRGLRAVCLERLDGQQIQVMILPRGGSVPLHGGSGARVLLAYADPQVQQEFLGQPSLDVFTPSTPAADALRDELAKIRGNGYCVSVDDVVPGIAAVGAPIFDQKHEFRAAISVAGPVPSVVDEMSERTRTLVIQAATDVSTALGCRSYAEAVRKAASTTPST